MKKLLILMLALLMVCSCFVACGGGDTDETKAPTTSKPKVDEYGREYIEDSIPEDLSFANANKNTVTFFTRNDRETTKIEMDTETTTNNTMNDAVFYRNATVEDRLGITINQIGQPGTYGVHTEWLNQLRNSVLTKSGDYDCAAVYASQGSALALEGMYYNVKDLDRIDFSKVWWNQSLLSELELFDTLYFLGGDIALTQTEYAGFVAYNKKIYDEYFMDTDIYQLVRDGEWTIDKLYEMSSQVWVDENNSGIADDGDILGYQDVPGSGYLDLWLAALGIKITEFDSEGYPYLTFYNEKSINAFEKLRKLNYDNRGAAGFSAPRTETKFANENVLFNATVFEYCEQFRDMNASYGALPLPKYDTEQEDYATYVQNGCSLITVLSTCKDSDKDLIGATLELMAAESYRQVTPQYYEICLKGKYSSNAEDAEMYDTILKGIKLDFGFIYATASLEAINSLFRDLEGDFAKNYQSNQIKYEEALEKLVDKLDELSFMA